MNNLWKNRKGFTMVELLLTLVILAIVIGMALTTLGFNMEKAGEKTEEVFVKTLEDAIDAYVSSEFNSLNSSGTNSLVLVDTEVLVNTECPNKIIKSHGEVCVYEIKIKNDDDTLRLRYVKFSDIINSDYHLLTTGEFVNPANESKDDSRFRCNVDAEIKLYRDDDYVYYYYVDKSALGCLNNINDEYGTAITNLPLVNIIGTIFDDMVENSSDDMVETSSDDTGDGY